MTDPRPTAPPPDGARTTAPPPAPDHRNLAVARRPDPAQDPALTPAPVLGAGPVPRAGPPSRAASRAEPLPVDAGTPREHPARPVPDLARLLARVARGEHDAFDGLYDAVAGPVYGVVRAVLIDHAQSEEVVQDVLVEVWRTAPRYRAERGTPVNWILTLAHRRAIDRVRSAEACAARERRAALLDRAPAYDQVTEQVEARIERELLHGALASLTDLQRQAVTLAYYRGLTYRQVAEQLAVPLGTVKTRLRDALIRLRASLSAPP